MYNFSIETVARPWQACSLSSANIASLQPYSDSYKRSGDGGCGAFGQQKSLTAIVVDTDDVCLFGLDRCQAFDLKFPPG